MSLQVTVPDIIAQALGDEPEKALLEPWLVKLAKRGDLSLSDLEQLLGLSCFETIQWCGEHGVDWMGLEEGDLEYGKNSLHKAKPDS